MSEPLDPSRQFQIDVLGQLSALQASLAKTSETFTSQISVIQSTQAEMSANLAETRTLATKSLSLATDTGTRVDAVLSVLSEFNISTRDAIAQVATDQVRLRVEIMARIDRLQATVDLVREDARVNWATADTAMNRVKN